MGDEPQVTQESLHLTKLLVESVMNLKDLQLIMALKLRMKTVMIKSRRRIIR